MMIDLLGSFFPIWFPCIVAGVILTAGTRWLLRRADLDGAVGPPVVIYPSLVTLFSCVIWLIYFGS
jgi:hypothetical protein